MPYMKESDTVVFFCGDGDQSIGVVNSQPAMWYGPAELMPHMEYERAYQGQTFGCIDGTQYVVRGDGWEEVDEGIEPQEILDDYRTGVQIWA